MKNININNFLENIQEHEEEESSVVMCIPYMSEEFKTWLIEHRNLKAKYAEDYLRNYESAYESLYDIVGLDLYELLHSFLVEIPAKTGSNLTKEAAPGLIDIYTEAIQEELDKKEDEYTKLEFRALMAYHDFIVEVADSCDAKQLKEKTTPLPDEEDFLAWLETEYRMDYDNATKIASSVKNMDLVLPSLVTKMSFLDVLRALPDKATREKYLSMVNQKKDKIFAEAARTRKTASKTIQNGITNIKYYMNFINHKTQNQ